MKYTEDDFEEYNLEKARKLTGDALLYGVDTRALWEALEIINDTFEVRLPLDDIKKLWESSEVPKRYSSVRVSAMEEYYLVDEYGCPNDLLYTDSLRKIAANLKNAINNLIQKSNDNTKAFYKDSSAINIAEHSDILLKKCEKISNTINAKEKDFKNKDFFTREFIFNISPMDKLKELWHLSISKELNITNPTVQIYQYALLKDFEIYICNFKDIILDVYKTDSTSMSDDNKVTKEYISSILESISQIDYRYIYKSYLIRDLYEENIDKLIDILSTFSGMTLKDLENKLSKTKREELVNSNELVFF